MGNELENPVLHVAKEEELTFFFPLFFPTIKNSIANNANDRKTYHTDYSVPDSDKSGKKSKRCEILRRV